MHTCNGMYPCLRSYGYIEGASCGLVRPQADISLRHPQVGGRHEEFPQVKKKVNVKDIFCLYREYNTSAGRGQKLPQNYTPTKIRVGNKNQGVRANLNKHQVLPLGEIIVKT